MKLNHNSTGKDQDELDKDYQQAGLEHSRIYNLM